MLLLGPKKSWKTKIMEFDDNTFFLEMTLQQSNVFIWIPALLTETQCEGYSADVGISKKDDTIRVRYLC